MTNEQISLLNTLTLLNINTIIFIFVETILYIITCARMHRDGMDGLKFLDDDICC